MKKMMQLFVVLSSIMLPQLLSAYKYTIKNDYAAPITIGYSFTDQTKWKFLNNEIIKR